MVQHTPNPSPPYSRSLKRRFTGVMLLGVVLPAVAMLVLLTWYESRQQAGAIHMRTASVAESTARSIEEFSDAHLAPLETLARRREEERTLDDAARWHADLSRLRRHYPAMLTLLVADADGRIVATAPLGFSASRQVADRAYFQVPRQTGRPYVSDAFRGRGFGRDPIVAVAAPLTGPDGFAGIVEASLRTDVIGKPSFDALEERSYEALLVDRAGTVIHATDGMAVRTLVSFPNAQKALRERPDEVHGWLRDGGPGYLSIAEVSNGWTLFVLVPRSILRAEVARNLYIPVTLLVLLLGGVMLSFWLSTRALRRGVQRLLDTLKAFALGEDVAREPSGLPDELQPVMSAITALSDRLNVAYERLHRSLDQQHALSTSLKAEVESREREIAASTEELRRANEELDRISRTDALTGCLNYRGFHEKAPLLCRQAGQGVFPLAALALDVDHFKAYNDRYGHMEGDNALRRFASAVGSALYRPEDVFCRTGGEEFVALLPDATREQALAVAARIRECVHGAAIAHAGSPSGFLTVSIGVASFEGSDDDCDALLSRADAALYRAKRAGRDCVAE